MADSNSSSTKKPEENHIGSGQPDSDSMNDSPEDGFSTDGELNQLFEQAQDWIKENQTTAMLGGFGLGVFIGVLLRR